MRKLAGLLTGIFLFAVFAVHANALTVDLNSNGSWSNPVGGLFVEYPSPDTILWGGQVVVDPTDPTKPPQLLPADPKSGLRFQGIPAASVGIDEVFSLGTLFHHNFPVELVTAISAVTLDITLNVTAPTPAQLANFSFDFDVLETPNNSANPEDLISFPTSFAAETLTLNNEVYTLQLLGFGIDEQNIISSFVSHENSINSTFLWGKITANPVPEPASLLLFGSGLLGVALVARRKQA